MFKPSFRPNVGTALGTYTLRLNYLSAFSSQKKIIVLSKCTRQNMPKVLRLKRKGPSQEVLFCMESVRVEFGSLFVLSVARFMRFISETCKPATAI